ncbi:hypothetical protein [Kitasatospora sp. NBC_01266]|nr:hypothetical protein [Kitasatospora sp. NBC_01266]
MDVPEHIARQRRVVLVLFVVAASVAALGMLAAAGLLLAHSVT